MKKKIKKYADAGAVSDPSLFSQASGMIGGSPMSYLPMATNVAMGLAGEEFQNSVAGETIQGASTGATIGNYIIPGGIGAAGGALVGAGIGYAQGMKDKKIR